MKFVEQLIEKCLIVSNLKLEHKLKEDYDLKFTQIGLHVTKSINKF
jgi:hypothetical protein